MLLGSMDSKHGVDDFIKRHPHKGNTLSRLSVGIRFPNLPSLWNWLVLRQVLRLQLMAQGWQVAGSEGPVQHHGKRRGALEVPPGMILEVRES